MTGHPERLALQRVRAIMNFVAAVVLIISAGSASGVARQARGGQIDGVVLSGDSAPLARERVWLAHKGDKGAWAPLRNIETDETGRFRFDKITPGHYQLSVGGEGRITRVYPDPHLDGQEYLDVQEGGVVSNLRIVVESGARIAGVVRNRSGESVSGFTVKLFNVRDATEPSLAGETKTDKSGAYVLDKIPLGRYLIRADRIIKTNKGMRLEVGYYPKGASQDSSVLTVIQSGASVMMADVMISDTVASAVITGRVTDSVTGKPLQGVKVVAEEFWERSPVHPANAITEADGSYRVEGILPGRYHIKAEGQQLGNGYQMGSRQFIVTGSHAVDFELIPAPLIIATVQYIGSLKAPAPGDYAVSLEFDCRNCQTGASSTYRGQGETFEFRSLPIAPVHITAGFASLRYAVARVLIGDEEITDKWIALHAGETLTNVRVLITDRPGIAPDTGDRRRN